MRADALWEMKRRRDNLREQSRLLHPELLAPDWLSGPHPPPSRAWSHGPTDRSYGTIGRSRSNPPLLTRVARMRADALWEMKRRRDNLREQSRLLHPELLAPDWLSGPHPPLHGRGVTGPPIGPTGPSVGAAPSPLLTRVARMRAEWYVVDWWIGGLVDWWIGGCGDGLVDWWIGGLVDWWMVSGLMD